MRIDPTSCETFTLGGSDPDDLAVTHAAALVTAGHLPIIEFVVNDVGVSTGIRVRRADGQGPEKVFSCFPMAMPSERRELLAAAMMSACGAFRHQLKTPGQRCYEAWVRHVRGVALKDYDDPQAVAAQAKAGWAESPWEALGAHARAAWESVAAAAKGE